jgi:hypothetical protein
MKLLSSMLGLLLSLQLVHAQQTINSIASGKWASTDSWDLGRAPHDGDIIVIHPSHTILMDQTVRLANVVLRFSGHLTVGARTGMVLNSGSIINVLTGGRIDGQNTSGDAWISLGNVVKYRSSKSYDPNWGTGILLGLAYATSTSGNADQGGQGFIFGTLPAVWQDLQLFKTPEDFVQMIWVTSHESTARTFSIERSRDSRYWEGIGSIRSEGVANSQVIYSFIDNAPGTGTIYYRVGQENGDGTITTTPIRSVHIDVPENSQLKIYPNPTRDIATLVLPKVPSADLAYEWMDASGRILRKGVQPAGAKVVQADLSDFPAGIYFIRLHGAEQQVNLGRLVKY